MSDLDEATTLPHIFVNSPENNSSKHYFLMMGNTFLFREPVLCRERCLALMALGKDCTSLLYHSNYDQRILLPPLITPKLLTSGLDLSVLFRKLRDHLSPIQVKVLF